MGALIVDAWTPHGGRLRYTLKTLMEIGLEFIAGLLPPGIAAERSSAIDTLRTLFSWDEGVMTLRIPVQHTTRILLWMAIAFVILRRLTRALFTRGDKREQLNEKASDLDTKRRAPLTYHPAELQWGRPQTPPVPETPLHASFVPQEELPETEFDRAHGTTHQHFDKWFQKEYREERTKETSSQLRAPGSPLGNATW